MPPAPDLNGSVEEVEHGMPVDTSMMVETGGKAPLEQADPIITTKPKKRPWYRRPRILYSIAISVALISIGLAVFAILWATDIINVGDSASVSAAGSTEGGIQDNGGTDNSGGTTPATEPTPPPQEVPPSEPATPGQTPPPTATPTALATEPPRTDPLSFYVMGDVPYAQWEEIMLSTQMGEMSANLDPGAAFTVHVGDMQKAMRTNCEIGYFYQVANILLQGPLPTFVQVGDNDYLDCPDPALAFANYRNTFVGFEGNWSHSFNVERWTTPESVPMEYDITRQVANPEMFAFVEDGILFMSYTLLNMNLDQGEEPDDLFYERLADSKAWVTKQLNEKKSQRIRGVVMFSHAMVSPDIRPFFEDLKDIFANAGIYTPVLYIHGDGHDWKINTELGQNLGWPQLTRVEVDQGAFADPLLITVAPSVGGVLMPLTADDSGMQFVLGNGLFLLDRQNGRYPDSVKPDDR